MGADMGKVIMGAEALDGYLTEDDLRHLNEMNVLYQETIENFTVLEKENEAENTAVTKYIKENPNTDFTLFCNECRAEMI